MENKICSCVSCGKEQNESDMKLRAKAGYLSGELGYHCAACADRKDKVAALKAARSNYRRASARTGSRALFGGW